MQNKRLRQFAAEFLQALFFLAFNFTGLIAGGLIATYFSAFDFLPWALLIDPGILSAHGCC